MNTELTKGFVDFIDDNRLQSLIHDTKEDPAAAVYREILKKSLSKQPLTVEETAALIAVNSPEGLHEIFETARELKRSVYGNRIVLFAPLYIGNYCTNDCQYCGFRRSLRSTVRHTLSDEELVREVKSLEDEGHKRLILVYGEHAKYTPEFIAHTVKMSAGSTSMPRPWISRATRWSRPPVSAHSRYSRKPIIRRHTQSIIRTIPRRATTSGG